MKASLSHSLFLFAAGVICAAETSSAGSRRSAVTPVGKVVQLLDGMLAKGKAAKHDEQVQFAAYKQFCEDTSIEKKRAIEEADQTIEVLKADIEKYSAVASKLTREITTHDEDIAVWTDDTKAATKVRETEKIDFDKTHEDYSESIDALERAIAVLKKQGYDRDQASLVQVSALKSLNHMPNEARDVIEAFLAEDPSAGLAVSAPEAYGYEFQSHGVIDMLEKLLEKFAAERTTLENTEVKSKHAFDMLIQDLTAQIEQANTDKEGKTATKAKKLKAKATAKGDLEDTVSTREADVEYSSDLVATCELKASEFETRQQLREEELEAIGKAIEIISSDAVAGNAQAYLPSMVQAEGQGLSLAQLRMDSATHSRLGRAQRYLQSRAGTLQSRVLAAVSSRVAADPFTKVKKMIKDLIARLLEEANDEAEHKGWCDTELSTNEQTRKEKTAAVETLHADIDQLEASVAKLTEEISELTAAVGELDATMAQAAELRRNEKATNAATVEDAEEAQTAVAQALIVLKEFYAKAGEATALVQEGKEHVAPAIWDSPYKGLQPENGGVIGMLEVIQSDFARLASETKASEATAQQEYDKFITDSKVDKAAKTQDIEHKTEKKQDESQALSSSNADLEGTQKELDATLAYFDKLKPSCVEAGVSYDDRVSRRREEIESLQEALRIMNGEDIA